MLEAQEKLILAGDAHMEACDRGNIKNIPGFQHMRCQNTDEVFVFLLSDEPCLLAVGSYGAAGGVQGYGSQTGKQIRASVKSNCCIFFVDIFLFFVNVCNDFDKCGGPDLWKQVRCVAKETFKVVLNAMSDFVNKLMLCKQKCVPTGSTIFLVLGQAVGVHWGPIGQKLQDQCLNLVMHIFPFHPCRYYEQPVNLQTKFKQVGQEVLAMFSCFCPVSGKFDYSCDLAKMIAERKKEQLRVLDELEIPHEEGFFIVQLRVLRNIDLTQKAIYNPFAQLKTALKAHFILFLQLPGTINKAAYKQGFVNVLIRFVTAYGLEKALRLFANGCFQARIGNIDYLDLFIQFVAAFGVPPSVRLFACGCFANRIGNIDYLDLFIQFVAAFGVPPSVRLFSCDCFANRIGNIDYI